MPTRLSSSVLVFVGILLLLAAAANAKLSESFYAKTCPGGVTAVRNVVVNAVRNDRRYAAGLLRMHFHDCWVRPLSELVQAFSPARTFLPSLQEMLSASSVDPDESPPRRRDGIVSRAAEASSQLPTTTMGFRAMSQNFARKGLSESDLVILSGADTIGLTHCRDITPRLYNFAGSSDGADPYLNKTFVHAKRRVCPNTEFAANNLVGLDLSKGGQSFDKGYYVNVLKHKATFKSDNALIAVRSGLNMVHKILRNPQSRFFHQFGTAMEKLGRIGVLTGRHGQIRRTCSMKN